MYSGVINIFPKSEFMFTPAGMRKETKNPFTMLTEEKKKHIIFQEERDETAETPALLKQTSYEMPQIDLPVDVYNDDEEIVIVAQIAGVSKDELSISVKEEVLTISGEIRQPLGLPTDKRFLHTQECVWGSFSRPIILPQNVDIRHINAKVVSDSILVLRLPKTSDVDQVIRVEIQ